MWTENIIEANPEEVRNSRKDENEISLGKDGLILFFGGGEGRLVGEGNKRNTEMEVVQKLGRKTVLCQFDCGIVPKTPPLFLGLSGLNGSPTPRQQSSHLSSSNFWGTPFAPSLHFPLSSFSPSFVSISSPTPRLKQLFLVPSVGERWRRIGERLARESETD